MVVRPPRASARQGHLVASALVQAVDVAHRTDGPERFEIPVNRVVRGRWETGDRRGYWLTVPVPDVPVVPVAEVPVVPVVPAPAEPVCGTT